MDLTTLKTVIGSARAVFPHVATKQDASYLRGVDAGLVAALEPLETDGTMSATEALQVLSRAHSSFDVTDPYTQGLWVGLEHGRQLLATALREARDREVLRLWETPSPTFPNERAS